MRIGILTGGGDAPGLNSVIETVSKKLLNKGIEVIGIRDGFVGVYENDTVQIQKKILEDIHVNSGTILGTSNKRGIDTEEEFITAYNKLNLNGLVVAGGDGTFKALSPLINKIPIIGIPKTIDNDIAGTDLTFGHDTACNVVSNAIDSLKYSARAHNRIILLEAMGRYSGWIALNGGLAGYADSIVIPEKKFDLDEFYKFIESKLSSGKRGLVCCVAEGAKIGGKNIIQKIVHDSPEPKRLGGVSSVLCDKIEKETKIETRNVILGYLQRSERPTVFDRLFTIKLACEAAELVLKEKWGQGLAYRHGEIISTELTDFCEDARLIQNDEKSLFYAKELGIFI